MIYEIQTRPSENSVVIIKEELLQNLSSVVAYFERELIVFEGCTTARLDLERLTRHFPSDRESIEEVGRKMLAARRTLGAGEEFGGNAFAVGSHFRKLWIEELAGQSCLLLLCSGSGIISQVSALAGDPDPILACPGTIRGDLCDDSLEMSLIGHRALRDGLLASQDCASAIRETQIWFPERIAG